MPGFFLPEESPGAADGIVFTLSGDDDSQVSDQVEQVVFAAVQRGADDEPLEGF